LVPGIDGSSQLEGVSNKKEALKRENDLVWVWGEERAEIGGGKRRRRGRRGRSDGRTNLRWVL